MREPQLLLVGQRLQAWAMEDKPDWPAQVAAWRQSGESMAGYCRHRGLSVSAMGYWKRRLEQQQATTAAPASVPLARVRKRRAQPEGGADGATGSALRLMVGGVAVEVPPRFDAATLARVLDVLQTRGAA